MKYKHVNQTSSAIDNLHIIFQFIDDWCMYLERTRYVSVQSIKYTRYTCAILWTICLAKDDINIHSDMCFHIIVVINKTYGYFFKIYHSQLYTNESPVRNWYLYLQSTYVLFIVCAKSIYCSEKTSYEILHP